MSGTWGSPILPSGIDMFDKPQHPRPKPVDDLSRFVLQRIHFEETQPVIDGIPKAAAKSQQAMAHRYAGYVRQDMVAFRRVVDLYVSAVALRDALPNLQETVLATDIADFDGQVAMAQLAVKALAMRWQDHHEFRAEWRLA